MGYAGWWFLVGSLLLQVKRPITVKACLFFFRKMTDWHETDPFSTEQDFGIHNETNRYYPQDTLKSIPAWKSFMAHRYLCLKNFPENGKYG